MINMCKPRVNEQSPVVWYSGFKYNLNECHGTLLCILCCISEQYCFIYFLILLLAMLGTQLFLLQDYQQAVNVHLSLSLTEPVDCSPNSNIFRFQHRNVRERVIEVVYFLYLPYMLEFCFFCYCIYCIQCLTLGWDYYFNCK